MRLSIQLAKCLSKLINGDLETPAIPLVAHHYLTQTTDVPGLIAVNFGMPNVMDIQSFGLKG